MTEGSMPSGQAAESESDCAAEDAAVELLQRAGRALRFRRLLHRGLAIAARRSARSAAKGVPFELRLLRQGERPPAAGDGARGLQTQPLAGRYPVAPSRGERHVDARTYFAEQGEPVEPPIAVHFVDAHERPLRSLPADLRLQWSLTVGWGDTADALPVPPPLPADDGVFLFSEVLLERRGFGLLQAACVCGSGSTLRALVPVQVLPPRPPGVTSEAWRLAMHLSGEQPGPGAEPPGLSALRAQACFPALLRHAASEPQLQWLAAAARPSDAPRAALELPQLPVPARSPAAAAAEQPAQAGQGQRRWPLQRLSRRSHSSWLPPSSRRGAPQQAAGDATEAGASSRRQGRGAGKAPAAAPPERPWIPVLRRGADRSMGKLIADAVACCEAGRPFLPPLRTAAQQQQRQAVAPAPVEGPAARPQTAEWEDREPVRHYA
eukprot:TRINITY_DN16212_c0_g1_i1.p1 TRINITY_DN16212_c0_g1~~TRINITY_DN16212_c0_g1_i1.p1  ORF type:complete len:459 (+),score=134.00 TRINITY_DN16212_c0_g1_i1:71-1378(+)